MLRQFFENEGGEVAPIREFDAPGSTCRTRLYDLPGNFDIAMIKDRDKSCTHHRVQNIESHKPCHLLLLHSSVTVHLDRELTSTLQKDRRMQRSD
jgi:hypothetical protein